MMPRSTARSLPEEMLATELARAASGPVPVRVALAQQGLAWAALQPAGPFQAGARRVEPVRLASVQVVPFRAGGAQPARAASEQADPPRAGGAGQADRLRVASAPVVPLQVGGAGQADRLRVAAAPVVPLRVAAGQVDPLRAQEEALPVDPPVRSLVEPQARKPCPHFQGQKGSARSPREAAAGTCTM
jgi:hypothetical protein